MTVENKSPVAYVCNLKFKKIGEIDRAKDIEGFRILVILWMTGKSMNGFCLSKLWYFCIGMKEICNNVVVHSH